MYRCIIIDDQQRSIDNLVDYIERYGHLEIVKQFSEPLRAFEEISRMEKVDVIFMDVDMPTLTGIELAKMVRHKTDKLIFTTAHSKYAFEAYQVRAEAFLLKPFSFARFVEEVSLLLPPDHSDNGEEINSGFFFVKLKETGKIVPVEFRDIVFFESFTNYIKIFTASREEPLVSYLTLKDILNILSVRNIKYFIQIHRAFIVSLKHIESISGNMVRMHNKKEIQIGGHYKAPFKSLLEKKLLTTNRNTPK